MSSASNETGRGRPPAASIPSRIVRPPFLPRYLAPRLPFFYGWIIVSLGFVSAFFGIGLTWAAGLFFVPMHDDLGWSRASYFFAVSLRGWIGIVVTPLMGGFLDRKSGPRLLMLKPWRNRAPTLSTLARPLLSPRPSRWRRMWKLPGCKRCCRN